MKSTELRKIEKAFMKRLKHKTSDITINGNHDTFSDGLEFMEVQIKKTFEELGKLLEEMEELDLN